ENRRCPGFSGRLDVPQIQDEIIAQDGHSHTFRHTSQKVEGSSERSGRGDDGKGRSPARLEAHRQIDRIAAAQKFPLLRRTHLDIGNYRYPSVGSCPAHCRGKGRTAPCRLGHNAHLKARGHADAPVRSRAPDAPSFRWIVRPGCGRYDARRSARDAAISSSSLRAALPSSITCWAKRTPSCKSVARPLTTKAPAAFNTTAFRRCPRSRPWKISSKMRAFTAGSPVAMSSSRARGNPK